MPRKSHAAYHCRSTIRKARGASERARPLARSLADAWGKKWARDVFASSVDRGAGARIRSGVHRRACRSKKKSTSAGRAANDRSATITIEWSLIIIKRRRNDARPLCLWEARRDVGDIENAIAIQRAVWQPVAAAPRREDARLRDRLRRILPGTSRRAVSRRSRSHSLPRTGRLEGQGPS